MHLHSKHYSLSYLTSPSAMGLKRTDGWNNIAGVSGAEMWNVDLDILCMRPRGKYSSGVLLGREARVEYGWM